MVKYAAPELSFGPGGDRSVGLGQIAQTAKGLVAVARGVEEINRITAGDASKKRRSPDVPRGLNSGAKHDLVHIVRFIVKRLEGLVDIVQRKAMCEKVCRIDRAALKKPQTLPHIGLHIRETVHMQ